MTTAHGKKLAFSLYANNIPLEELNDMIRVGNDLGKLAEIICMSK